MSIKEIYDVSFIKMKGSENIDMQGNNLYQVNKLLFTSSLGQLLIPTPSPPA